jgi:hypothetical protein
MSFNSKKELDNLMIFIQGKAPQKPSEITAFYNDIESFLKIIYGKGVDDGYIIGVNLKDKIDKIK